MRQPRLKPADQDVFHHCYNRVAGDRYYLPFGDTEKAFFMNLLKRLDIFYTVDVVAYEIMGNHFHLLLRTSQEVPSPEEVCRRYAAYHRGERKLSPKSRKCARLATQIRDVSYFMKDLSEHFAKWFNRTRPIRRRGSLWAERFKNTVLEEGEAVWSCLKYIEMNAVRATIVSDPADYRFGSFGAWSRSGRHPFRENAEKHLIEALSDSLGIRSLKELRASLRRHFDLVLALERGDSPSPSRLPEQEPGELTRFSTDPMHRVRHWVDGLVIGSETFIAQIVAKARGVEHTERHRLSRSLDPPQQGSAVLCAYRQLRARAS